MQNDKTIAAPAPVAEGPLTDAEIAAWEDPVAVLRNIRDWMDDCSKFPHCPIPNPLASQVRIVVARADVAATDDSDLDWDVL